MRLRLNSLADTRQFAEKIAKILVNQDIVLLFGDLGAGKTFFARALIQAMNPEIKEVPSPTFTLVQMYETPEPEKMKIRHFDLYRLENPSEIWEIGFEEALAEGISLIEWPERMGGFCPGNALEIHLALVSGSKDARDVEIIPRGHQWQERLCR